MKGKLILFTVFVLLFPVLITGCWDRTEVDELAIVIGVGIDRIPGNEPILLTVQIVNPATIKSTTKEDGAAGKTFIVLESQGKSFFDAIRNLSKLSPRRLFFSHNKIVVLGKDFAKLGIAEVMDYMDRDREFRRINWILVADKTAKEVLETKLDIERLPAKGLETMMSNLKNQAFTYPINRNEFIIRLKDYSGVSYAPLISLIDAEKDINKKLEQFTGNQSNKSDTENSKKMQIEKTVIFKNNRFIGILSEEESKGHLWLINKLKGDTVVIPPKSGESNQEITMDIFEGNTKITHHVTKKGITMEIVCTGNAILREAGSTRMELNDLKKFRQLELESEKILKRKVERTIVRAQNFKADFVGFGNQIHNNFPQEMNAIKKDWDQIFPGIKYQVTFRIKILRMGKIKNPATLKF